MESLTLNDGHPYARRTTDSYRSKDLRPRSSRLPTPEDSQSSNEGLDGRSPHEAEQPSRDLPMRSVPGERYASYGPSNGASHGRRDSRNTGAPYSPPYRSPESQKPSLPPLKTVLGASNFSPPRTPSPHHVPMQLCAREPSYTASTLPLSLYPNKKQRTEPFPRLSYGVTDPARPTFAPSAVLEPRTNSISIRPGLQFPALHTSIDSIEARRHSVIASPPCGPHQQLKDRATNDNPARHYQTPEQTPTSAMLEPSFPKAGRSQSSASDPFARELRDSFGQADDRAYYRRPSVGGYAAYPGPPYEHDNPRLPLFAHDPRYAGPMREPYSEHRDYARSARAESVYGQAPYPGQGPAFFMPSHYEYQHGKARKRSNLPKQSTEIMKTWFDQNITNPYPSEEQKAVFSNATGISMTQVSNWFINHRRRCPELRDRRERGRGGSDA